MLFLLINRTDGQTVFNRNYDIDSVLNNALSVIQTLDGGYFTGGADYDVSSGAGRAFVLKTNSVGDTLWDKVWDFCSIGGDQVRSLLQLDDSSYVVLGNTVDTVAMNWDVFLLKLNSIGDTVWMKTYSIGTGIDLGYKIKKTNDGGFIIAGRTNSNTSGPNDYYLIKTDSAGNLQWQYQYGGVNNDDCYSIDIATDGGYILGGHTSSYGAGSADLFLLKVNNVGIFQWQKTFGTIAQDYGETVITTLDGGYIITGAIDDGTGVWDAHIVKTDSSGNMQWNKTFRSSSDYESLNVIKQLADSTYILAGSTYLNSSVEFEGWLMKIESNGDSIWSKTYGGPIDLPDYFYGLDLTDDGGIVACGQYNRIGSPYQNLWLVKTDCMGNDSIWDSVNCSLITSMNIDTFKNENIVKIYPNPFSSSATIEIATESKIKYDFILYDQLGRQMKKIMNITEKRIIIEKDNLNSGMYFYKISSSEKIIGTGKILID